MNFYLVPFGCVWTWGIPSTSGQSNWCGILVFIRSYKFQTNHIERCFQQSAPMDHVVQPIRLWRQCNRSFTVHVVNPKRGLGCQPECFGQENPRDVVTRLSSSIGGWWWFYQLCIFWDVYGTYLAIVVMPFQSSHGSSFWQERKARLLSILGENPQMAVVKKHVSEEALRTSKRVVVIGETGAGKSAFCGLLEGSLEFVDGDWTSTFKLGHGSSSETNEPKLLAAQWRFRAGRDDVLPILLLDTPGLGDSRGSQKDDEHMAEVARWVNGLGHVHAMVILLKNQTRISLSLRENLQFFQQRFGSEMWDHSLMVVNRWSHETKAQKKRREGKRQTTKQFEEEFRHMLQQDASGDGEDSDIGVGLSKERAEKLPFFFFDTHYDRDDEDEVKSMENELREMKRWLRSMPEWKVGINSQSKELKELILAVSTTELAEHLQEALHTALNVQSPPKDLTGEKLDAVMIEIERRREDERQNYSH